MKFIWIFLLAIGLSACGSETDSKQGPSTDNSSNVETPPKKEEKVVTKPKPAPEKPPLPEGWVEKDASGYSLYYPEKWEVANAAEAGANFMIFSELESKEDVFRENVNLLIQDLQGRNMDLDGFTKLSEKQVGSMITDSEILISKKGNDGTYDYHELVYTGRQGEYPLKWMQYYWVEKGNAYILTFTAQTETFDAFEEDARKILGSFRLK